jgi:hypothetical protein
LSRVTTRIKQIKLLENWRSAQKYSRKIVKRRVKL